LIEGVIFDLDGTLINLPVDYAKLFEDIRKIIKKEAVRPLLETVSKLDAKTRREVFKVWDKAELDASAKMAINEEGIAVYKRFQQKPKALVTMQGRTLMKIALLHFRLAFCVTVTREDSLSRVEQLEKAFQRLGTTAQNLLFVGNTEDDSLAAEKTRCQFLKVKSKKTAMQIPARNSQQNF
jgi:phosphoglycolate phosphatase-like HAD superfamily hydrolase